MAIEVDQLEKLQFELIEDLQLNSSNGCVEGIFIVHIIEVLDSDEVADQEESVDVFFVNYKLWIVLLGPVEQEKRVDEDAPGAVHVFEHTWVKTIVRAM